MMIWEDSLSDMLSLESLTSSLCFSGDGFESIPSVPETHPTLIRDGGSIVNTLAADPPNYVSELIVTSPANGGPAIVYVSFHITPSVPHAGEVVRDPGTLSAAIVDADDTPDTILEFELAIDMKATTVAMQIENLTLANPGVEFGAYIYIASDGTIQSTPITTGDSTGVNINLGNISPSQVVGIVHSHPGQGYYPGDTLFQYPSPAATNQNGVIQGDWAVYDYYATQSSRGDLMRTYIINDHVMREYRGDDRDTITPGVQTPKKIREYWR